MFRNSKIDLAHRYLTRQANKLSERQLMIFLSLFVGLVAGFGTYLFESLLHFIKYALTSWFRADSANLFYLVYPAVGIILATLFVKYVIKDNISEGVMRVLYAISRRNSKIKPHNCYSSMVASATTIGFGGSVGPEAPIVMTGAAIGSNVGTFMRQNYKNTTILLGCGAAAALAAIFKAPITGVVFVLEILMLQITSFSIVPLLISAVAATSVTFFLNGFEPLFDVEVNNLFGLRHIPYYAILGGLCGLISVYFLRTNLAISSFFERINKQYVKWIIGGGMIGILIFLFPPLYAEGYDTLNALMHGDTSSVFDNSLFYRYRTEVWVIIAYLSATMLFKVVAMASTNAAGGVGGGFASSLFVGAMSGTVIALTLNTLFDLDLPLIGFTLVGMAGVMSGVMNAPLTSIFLIAELTGGYKLFVPLMLVAALSFVICYYLEPYSIYTKKLMQKGDIVTHNKDQAVLLFLDMKGLIEDDFSPIYENATLEDVVKILPSCHRNLFPVIDFDGSLRGFVTLDDIRKDMFDTRKYDSSISDYMTIPPAVITVGEPMNEILDKFEDTKAWNLPVVDNNKKYLGFISKSKIFSAYRELLLEISDKE
ncbi:MAG: chloride channel protein [Rikenellaceae bacterium]|nr:chloride channel protein [Rikenellaceae bacterium]